MPQAGPSEGLVQPVFERVAFRKIARRSPTFQTVHDFHDPLLVKIDRGVTFRSPRIEVLVDVLLIRQRLVARLVKKTPSLSQRSPMLNHLRSMNPRLPVPRDPPILPKIKLNHDSGSYRRMFSPATDSHFSAYNHPPVFIRVANRQRMMMHPPVLSPNPHSIPWCPAFIDFADPHRPPARHDHLVNPPGIRMQIEPLLSAPRDVKYPNSIANPQFACFDCSGSGLHARCTIQTRAI